MKSVCLNFLKLCLLTMFLWLAHSSAVWAEEELELYAGSAVLMDGDSGRLLYGKEADQELPMASTTKIMTCIVALEQAQEDLVCTVSANAAAQPKVKLGMVTGDTFYLNDLLYSLMLESHNDTAVCIAENVAGSVENFAQKMNEKAREIGCEQTYFITPNGLDAEDENGIHHTTAYELALIMRYCLTQSPKSQEFLKITQTSSYTFSNIDGTRSYGCTNHNALLTILQGAVSGKTGFTGKAGYCYVGALEQDDKLLIVSLLACGWPNNKGYKWVDCKKLFRYGLDNFEKRKLSSLTLETPPVQILDGQQLSVDTEVLWDTPVQRESTDTELLWNIQAQQENTDTESPGDISTQWGDMEVEVLMRPEEQVQVEVSMQERCPAPLVAGTILGSVRYMVDGHIYAEYPIAAQDTVEKRDFRYCLEQCFDFWMLK